MSTLPRQHIVVYGAGAVGCFYGARFAEAGHRVSLVARPARAAAITARGLLFESGGEGRRIPMEAVSEDAVVVDADWLLLCVKSPDTDEAARRLRPLLDPATGVVSLQNGVDNVDRLKAADIDALASVVYVAASMAGPDHLIHAGRGDLVVGPVRAPGTRSGELADQRALRFAALCEEAGIGCVIPEDVRVEQWTKLIVNCCYNAISALGRARYGSMLGMSSIRELMLGVVSECVAIARAERIALPGVEALFLIAEGIGQAMTQATSSTSQDIERGRHSEIDALNGHICRRGAHHGIPTPLNNALFALVKLRELALVAPGS